MAPEFACFEGGNTIVRLRGADRKQQLEEFTSEQALKTWLD